MSPQYGEFQSTNSWDRLAGLGHPSKFERVSRLGFVAAVTSLTAGQPNFAQCLAISWAGTIYIYTFSGDGQPSCWASAHILVCVWNISGPLNRCVPNSQGIRVWSLPRTSLNVKVINQGHHGQKNDVFNRYLGNRWTDMWQIHMEDTFDPSFG